MSAAITAAVVGGAISANQASKAQKAQKKAGQAAQAANAGAMEGNALWTARGNDAAERLQLMMGLNGGEGETYESLAAANRENFMKFVPDKKKKKKGGLGGALKSIAGGALKSIAVGGTDGGASGGHYVFDSDSQKALDEFVNAKLAKR